jgi:hypothetical protein
MVLGRICRCKRGGYISTKMLNYRDWKEENVFHVGNLTAVSLGGLSKNKNTEKNYLVVRTYHTL